MTEIRRLKASTTAFIMAILLITVGFFPICVNAFTTDRAVPDWISGVAGWPPVHDEIIDRALGFLAPTILGCIKAGAADQDQIGAFDADPRRHFCRSLFNESARYINDEYKIIRDMVNQDVPNGYVEAKEFGMLLHTMQDFYAHSNWVEIWNKKGEYHGADFDEETKTEKWLLYEPGLDLWYEYSDWDTYKHSLPVDDPVNIILAQTDPNNTYYYPPSYDYGLDRSTASGSLDKRYLSRIPWVKANNTDYYALVTTRGGCTFEPFGMEHDGCIAKDAPTGAFRHWGSPVEPIYDDAYGNAIAQTRHEFWRLLNLVKGFDYRGSSAILGYWLRGNWQQITPHLGLSATVNITNVNFNVPSGKPDVSGYAFVVYTGDFDSFVQRSILSKGGIPEPITLSLDSSDTLIMAVEPYSAPIPGATLWLNGSRLQSGTYHLANANMDATVSVSISAPEVGPVAEAGGPYGYYCGEEGAPVTLSAEDSYDIGGSITDYEWDLDGDGEYDDGTGITVDHTWSDDFYGTVGLRVTDNDGRSATSIAYVVIENVAPTVEFSHPEHIMVKGKEPPPDVEAYVEQELTVKATYFDPGPTDNNTYMIHWGEALQQVQIHQAPRPEGKALRTISASYKFSQAGTYNVTIRVEDKDGGFGTDLLTVNVTSAGPETPSPQFDWSRLFAILTSNTTVLIGIAVAVVAVAVGIPLYRRRRSR